MHEMHEQYSFTTTNWLSGAQIQLWSVPSHICWKALESRQSVPRSLPPPHRFSSSGPASSSWTPFRNRIGARSHKRPPFAWNHFLQTHTGVCQILL